jgi:hypothetical protein
MTNYKEKYLKYKLKYIELKNNIFGGHGRNDECVYCKCDWIYKKNPSTCEDCYNTQHKLVEDYHKLQDEAYKLIETNNINNAILKLKEVIKLRNEHAMNWFKGGDESHNRFSNEFLPNLIKLIESDKTNAKNIWDAEFAKLAEPMQ